jgi:hypothetical protein
MPRKRQPIKKPPKGERLIPLHEDRRPWYYAPLRVAANGLESLFGIFRRRPKPVVVQKKPPRPRRRRKSK